MTDMTTQQARPPVNIDLARRTLAAIEAHPGDWNQRVWRCRAGMCFAGWAATLAGAQWLTSLDSTDDVPTVHGAVGPFTASSYVRYDGDQIPHDGYFTEIPGARHVRDYARHALGLTDSQAERLFAGDNDLRTLQALVDALAADPAADLFRVHIPDLEEDYARHVLGLTDGQAERLFAGDNDLRTLQALVDALAADPAADLFRGHIPDLDD